MRVVPRGFLLGSTLIVGAVGATNAQATRFDVTVSPAAHPGPLTGRLVLIVATRDQPKPRYQLSPSGPAIFGLDLVGHPAGRPARVDAATLGYPGSLAELPPGDYVVQAVVNVYDEVRRADGRTLWLPMNDGRIEFFTTAAGNLVSEPERVTLGRGGTVRIAVDRVLPAASRPPDTEWIRRVSLQSPRLSAFWGRPVFIHATVLLPRDYAASPERRYPAIYALGHNVPFRFTTDSSGRGHGQIHPVTGVETGFDFFKSWIADDFPRVVAISLEQQTPYFPDSYSVNSANNGPYGDAFVEELVPFLEERFRLIREPWARQLEGASTSGWQSLALMLRNPDFFGGAWVLQPDPIDFRRYQLVDIYQDDNAFTVRTGPFTTAERPFRRTVEGQVLWTVRQLSRFEEVLGTRGRSGFQLGAWEAVYGPTDADGYPRPLWNKLTGDIDREVATHMREQGYDLREYAERNWDALGPKLVGKLHFFTGDMDDFYLNLAVYRFEEFLARDERYRDAFVYGRPMKGHSWHDVTWADMVRRIAATAERARPGRAATVPRDPDSSLVAALVTNRRALHVGERGMTGAGADLLVRETRAARFTLIGEEHGVREIPWLTRALLEAGRPAGYRAFAIEVSPLAADRLNGLARRGDPAAALPAFFGDDLNWMPFYTMPPEQDLLGWALSRPLDIWGLDYDVTGDRYWLRRLETLAAPSARAAVRAARAMADSGWALARRGDPSRIFSFTAPDSVLESLRAALRPAPESEAARILGVLEGTVSINRLFLSGRNYESNEARAANLKANFLARWRAVEHRASPPRVLLKFGAYHMDRGVNGVRQRDVGWLAAATAETRGERSFHALVVGGPDTEHAVFDVTALDYRQRPVEWMSQAWLAPVRAALDPTEAAVFDLRPLRALVQDRKLPRVSPELERAIFGFDVLVVLTGSKAAVP